MIRFKHIAAFLAFALCTGLSSKAQIGGGISAGYRGGIVNWKSFDQFQQSYSAFYKNSIKKDFTGFKIGNGYAVNGDMTVGAFVLGIRYSRYYSKNEVSFTSGGKRHFNARQSLLATAMGFGYQGENGHIQGTMALLIGNERINSFYEYSDGTKSFGSERGLNGVYDAIRMGWSGRFEASYNYFYLAGEYVFGKIAGIGSPLDDLFMESNGLPTSYDRWVKDPISYGVEEFVLPDMNGLRVEFGLRFNFSDR